MGSGVSDGAVGQAFWEWIPGVVAGVLPLAVYLLVLGIGGHEAPSLSPEHPPLINNDLEAHLLIFVIANSAVSFVSSHVRLFRLKGLVTEHSRSHLGLNLVTMVALVLGVAVYAILEIGTDGFGMTAASFGLLFLSLVPSFFVEIALARIAIANRALLTG